MTVDTNLAAHALRDLFEELVDLTVEHRQARMSALNLPARFRARLDAMLAADDRVSPLWQTSAADVVDRMRDDEEEIGHSLIGTRIGSFRLLALIGQGGSSVVFRAERDAGDGAQIVALKLLRTGLYSVDAQRRFRREQAILAQLTHPNIARLIEGGVSSLGIPYIAMELVEGVPITHAADARALSLEKRLVWFSTLCRTVEAAHVCLIVHRDLKPSNLFITREGELKVLDFGIAKVVDANDVATRTQSIALTPEYAAPEQYGAAPPTTAVDIFALGVVLGELLTGKRLASNTRASSAVSGLDETGHRQLNGLAPRKALARRLKGDLDAIVATALAQEPSLRYRSAGAFADDIERYLAGEPVRAHAPSLWYRARKFVGRHRVAVALSAAFGLAILAALGLALWQADVARSQTDHARIELGRANAMRDFMFNAFGEAGPGAPHNGPVTVVDAVERAIAKARQDRTTNPRARIELLTRLCSVLDSQGKFERAHELLDWTIAEATAALGADDALTQEAARVRAKNAELRGDYADARTRLDELLARSSADHRELRVRLLIDSSMLAAKVHEVARAHRESDELVQRAHRQPDPDLLLEALNARAFVLHAIDESAQSIAVYQELLAAQRVRFGDQHAAIAQTQADLSRSYRQIGDLDNAEKAAREALAIDRIVYTADDWNVATHLNALGIVLKDHRDFAGAIAAEEEALRIYRATEGDGGVDMLSSIHNLGMYHLFNEDFAQAVEPLRRSLQGSLEKFGDDHWDTAIAHECYGWALAMSGERVKGIAHIDRAIAIFTALSDPDPDLLAGAYEKRSRMALEFNDFAAALPDIDRMAATLKRMEKPSTYWDGRVATTRGNALLALHRTEEATRELEQGRVELAQSAHPSKLLSVENILLRAAVAQARGDGAAAYALAEEGRKALAALRSPTHQLVVLAESLPTR